MPSEQTVTEDGDIVHTTIEPDSNTSEYAFLQLIADAEGVEIEALPSLYGEVDHFLETLFCDPPSKKAQMELRFSYYGYRVTVDQTGHVTLVRVRETVPE